VNHVRSEPVADPPATAVRIAADVAAGRTWATDVVAAAAARHAAAAGRLNALVQPRFEQAAGDAAAIDAAVATGRLSAAQRLAGVPVSVKECFAVAGLTTTLGIPARRSAVDRDDASLVARLRSLGAVVVGKANVPQAMYLHETDNPVWGRTCHPLDAGRGPGGSSGGDAALVAAGVVPLALGNDLAGSLRQPAHCCGIATIVPRTTALGDGGGFDTMPHLRVVRPRAGFLARTVDDLALAADAVGVPAARPPDARAGLRIGWWDDSGPIAAAPAIRRAVREAVDRLREAGATIVPLSAHLAVEAAWLHLAILAADGGSHVRGLLAGSVKG
jgi:fatty acid amide hydrolase